VNDAGNPSTAFDTAAAKAELSAFIAALGPRTAAVAPTPLPELGEDIRDVAADGALIERFTAAAAAAGMAVHRATPASCAEVLGRIVQQLPARHVFLTAQADTALTPALAEALGDTLRRLGVRLNSTPDDETLFTVDAAITGVAAAVAETGTLVCVSAPDSARGASLIPPVHVAVVAAGQLVADLCDLRTLWRTGADLPANVNLISGPSKTADIEGVLVTGMHGPGQVHVILLDG
jgi:L-lactate dehydrogenase complex protein LldG